MAEVIRTCLARLSVEGQEGTSGWPFSTMSPLNAPNCTNMYKGTPRRLAFLSRQSVGLWMWRSFPANEGNLACIYNQPLQVNIEHFIKHWPQKIISFIWQKVYNYCGGGRHMCLGTHLRISTAAIIWMQFTQRWKLVLQKYCQLQQIPRNMT